MGNCCGGGNLPDNKEQLEESSHNASTKETPASPPKAGAKTQSSTEKKTEEKKVTNRKGTDIDLEKLDNEIRVVVLQGRALADKDVFGKSDPYCVVTVGKDSRQTPIVRNSLNPVWNEMFPFFGLGLVTRVDEINFEVYDYDRITKDDFIGSATITGLQKYRNHSGIPEWVILCDKSGRPSGEIQVQITVVDDYNVLSIREWTHVMELTVVSGGELDRLDWFTKSDPYVHTEWGTQAVQTRHISGTQNPVWNETAYLFVHSEQQQANHLKITVMDDDLRGDDMMGTGVVKGAHIFDSLNKSDGEMEIKVNLTTTNMQSDKWLSIENILKAEENEERACGHVKIYTKLHERSMIEEQFYTALIDKFDKDEDGQLDKLEVTKMMSYLDDPDDMAQFFRRYDEDANQTWSRPEILSMLQDYNFQRSRYLTKILHKFLSNDSEMPTAHLMSAVTRGPDGDQKVIHVKHRRTGLILQEHVPGYVWYALKLMYSTKTGRVLAKAAAPILTSMSVDKGRYYDKEKSKKEIKPFVKLHNLDLALVVKDLDQFDNFNDFFARSIHMKFRPVEDPSNEKVVLSPADCRMVLFPNIVHSSVWVKAEKWSITRLLSRRANDLANRFEGGGLVIARLAPQDYHRWHWPVSGIVRSVTPIDGELFTVNPLAVNSPVNVYTDNKRCLVEIDTGDTFGTVLLIAIGATMVGSYYLFQKDGVPLETPYENVKDVPVERGEVSGEFRFGGSTVLVLFEPGRVNFDDDLIKHSEKSLETLIDVRDQIGIASSAVQDLDDEKTN